MKSGLKLWNENRNSELSREILMGCLYSPNRASGECNRGNKVWRCFHIQILWEMLTQKVQILLFPALSRLGSVWRCFHCLVSDILRVLFMYELWKWGSCLAFIPYISVWLFSLFAQKKKILHFLHILKNQHLICQRNKYICTFSRVRVLFIHHYCFLFTSFGSAWKKCQYLNSTFICRFFRCFAFFT